MDASTSRCKSGQGDKDSSLLACEASWSGRKTMKQMIGGEVQNLYKTRPRSASQTLWKSDTDDHDFGGLYESGGGLALAQLHFADCV
jgi:hypothetical protein